MRYLITTKGNEPALTNWFDAENHFNHELGMIVFNLLNHTYTSDGINWNEITQDSL